MDLYYLVDSTPLGPISADALAALVRSGKLPGETLVCIVGDKSWEPFPQWAARHLPAESVPAPPAAAPKPAPVGESGLRLIEPAHKEESLVPATTGANAAVTCAKCGKSWAEHLTSAHGIGQRICRLCSAKEAEIAAAAKQVGGGGMSIPWATLSIIAVVVLLCVGGGYYLLPVFFTGPRAPGVTVYEPWSSKAPDQWPPIVLRNEAKFKGQPAVKTSLSVLVRRPVDVIGGTSGTVLGGAKNTDAMNALLPPDARPGLAPKDIAVELVSWTATATGKAKPPVNFSAVSGLGEAMNFHSRFFVTDASVKKTPVELLSVRRSTFTSGNPCIVLFVPPGTQEQRGMKGTVQRLGSGETLAITLEKPIPALGLAGAPIMDLGGQLGGLVHSAGEPVGKDGTISKLLAEPTSNFDTWMAFK